MQRSDETRSRRWGLGAEGWRAGIFSSTLNSCSLDEQPKDSPRNVCWPVRPLRKYWWCRNNRSGAVMHPCWFDFMASSWLVMHARSSWLVVHPKFGLTYTSNCTYTCLIRMLKYMYTIQYCVVDAGQLGSCCETSIAAIWSITTAPTCAVSFWIEEKSQWSQLLNGMLCVGRECYFWFVVVLSWPSRCFRTRRWHLVCLHWLLCL